MAFDLEDIIIVLTMGLGNEYDHFVTSIDAMADSRLCDHQDAKRGGAVWGKRKYPCERCKHCEDKPASRQ